MTDQLTSWAALVGILLPIVVAFLQRDHWSQTVNAILFGIAVVVASAVYGWIKYGSSFTWGTWASVLLAVIVWGLGTYHAYWKNGPVNQARAVPFPPVPSDKASSSPPTQTG